MAQDIPAPPPALTLTRRAFLRSSTVAVGSSARRDRVRRRRWFIRASWRSTIAGPRPSAIARPCADARPGTTASPAPGPAPAPPPPPNAAVTYSTTFDLTENPISEGGRWFNTGTLWTKVRTENGLAFGTNGPLNTYATSCMLTCLGLGPTSRLRPLSKSTLPFWAITKLELLLRWADSAVKCSRLRVPVSPQRPGATDAMEWSVRRLHRNAQRHWSKERGSSPCHE